MPIYEFKCASCEAVKCEYRTFERCSEPGACACGGVLCRQFTVPYLAMQHWLYNDENKRAFADVSPETLRAEDKAYEARRSRRIGGGKTEAAPDQTLLQVHEEMHGRSN